MRDFDWEIIDELYRNPNVSRAAAALYMTQPTLTKRLQHIERELGVSIAERTPKGLVFTPEGTYLAGRAAEHKEFVEQTKRAIREAPVRESEVAAAARSSRPQRLKSAPAPVAYADEDASFVAVPDDYVPFEAGEAAAMTPVAVPAEPPLGSLSSDERMQVAAERELLSALAMRPDEMRRYGERIASLSWCDEHHEAMAWAMLSTPDGTSPAEVVAAATAVVPEAPRLLSGGRVMGESGLSEDKRLDLIVDTAELFSAKRRIRQIRARLKSTALQDADTDALFSEATTLQRRVAELTRLLSTVSSE